MPLDEVGPKTPEDLKDTVMVEMTRYLWTVIAETAGATLTNMSRNRLIGPEDIGKQLYTPTLMRVRRG